MKSELIQEAYDIFSKYHLNDKVTGCYCEVCLSEEFNEFLHETPLRELNGFTLGCYIQAVDILDGSCNDFKYFFPRILEIICDEHMNIHHADFYIFIWNTLARIDFDSWGENEKELVVKFFSNYWNETKVADDPELISPSIEDINKQVFQKFSS